MADVGAHRQEVLQLSIHCMGIAIRRPKTRPEKTVLAPGRLAGTVHNWKDLSVTERSGQGPVHLEWCLIAEALADQC